MSEKYKVINSTVPTFVTCTIIDWVDLLIRPAYTKILDDSLNHCIREKGLSVHGYVYMTSHIHLIVSSPEGTLPSIMRDFKKFTSKKLVEAIDTASESSKIWLLKKFAFSAARLKRGKYHKIWKDGFHPIILDTYVKAEQRLNYTHDNPVAAEYVYHERDWRNSSYAFYEDNNPNRSEVLVEPLW